MNPPTPVHPCIAKAILTAACAALLSGNLFALTITTPGDPVLGVQLTGGTTITVATVGTVANVNNYPAAEAPAMSIDANNGSKYLNFAKTNTGIVVDPSDDLSVVKGLTLITANDAPERDPATFSIYGTNVSQSTTFLDYTLIVADVPILGTDPGRGQSSGLVSFTNPTNVPFDSYLVIFPTVRNAGGSNSMQVAEIRLDNVPEPGTFGLLALGSFACATLRRRRS